MFALSACCVLVLEPCEMLTMSFHFSQALDKPSRLTEKELAEAESKWAADTLERSDENNLGEISEFEVWFNFTFMFHT